MAMEELAKHNIMVRNTFYDITLRQTLIPIGWQISNSLVACCWKWSLQIREGNCVSYTDWLTQLETLPETLTQAFSSVSRDRFADYKCEIFWKRFDSSAWYHLLPSLWSIGMSRLWSVYGLHSFQIYYVMLKASFSPLWEVHPSCPCAVNHMDTSFVTAASCNVVRLRRSLGFPGLAS